MYTQRNKTKNNPQAERTGLLGFSVSSNCSSFGVPICFFLKKKYFSFVNVSRKQSADLYALRLLHLGQNWAFLGLCLFPVFSRPRFRSKMGLRCFGLLSSVAAQGSRARNRSAHTFGQVELFSPLQADSASGRSAVWPCTLPCSHLSPMSWVCT